MTANLVDADVCHVISIPVSYSEDFQEFSKKFHTIWQVKIMRENQKKRRTDILAASGIQASTPPRISFVKPTLSSANHLSLPPN